ncbi:hypothetical protein G4B88_008492 [Cannabis sativa]|uniref:Uncharacterized protein n=1 Tax=Cannabis sativa TaxID=3483 RepID=A0A7J6DVG0_CANSA|nr:hypothetical protein G4B88_008492 [Cannabis sativa]
MELFSPFSCDSGVSSPSSSAGNKGCELGRREESSGVTGNEGGIVGGGRPRLNLQPRTLPVVSDGGSLGSGSVTGTVAAIMTKPKGSNPFGGARPREEFWLKKGKTGKKIDEQLESFKIKEVFHHK